MTKDNHLLGNIICVKYLQHIGLPLFEVTFEIDSTQTASRARSMQHRWKEAIVEAEVS